MRLEQDEWRDKGGVRKGEAEKWQEKDAEEGD